MWIKLKAFIFNPNWLSGLTNCIESSPMDIRTQVRGVPHYDCAEMVFGPSEPFALEFTPHSPNDKNSILARLTTGNPIVGHVAAESFVEIAALRREYATSTLLLSATTIGPAKFGRKGLHVPIKLRCSIKCPNTDTDTYTYTEVTDTDVVVDANAGPITLLANTPAAPKPPCSGVKNHAQPCSGSSSRSDPAPDFWLALPPDLERKNRG
jgi:hypothetical protein